MMLLSAVICIPGVMAATGVAAWGRPGLRSIGLSVTLVTNVAVFVILVPELGVVGACVTSILSNVVMTTFMVVAASRVMDQPASSFLLPRASDIALAEREGRHLVRKALSRLPISRADRMSV